MRHAAALLILLVVPLHSTRAAQSAEERGLAIATEADRRTSGFGDSTSSLTMVLRDSRGGERTRELRSRTREVAGDGDQSVVIFESPPDVRGTAVLTYAHTSEDDDQWMYLPALRRVKRISSSNKSSPFMGSEFSYEDLANQEVNKYTYTWLRDDACPSEAFGSATCFVVESRPIGDDSGYLRLVTWVDQVEYRVHQIDYYDRRDNFLKTLAASDFREYPGGQWRAHRMTMSNQVSGKQTVLLWSDYEFDVGLTEEDFNPRNLTRIR